MTEPLRETGLLFIEAERNKAQIWSSFWGWMSKKEKTAKEVKSEVFDGSHNFTSHTEELLLFFNKAVFFIVSPERGLPSQWSRVSDSKFSLQQYRKALICGTCASVWKTNNLKRLKKKYLDSSWLSGYMQSIIVNNSDQFRENYQICSAVPLKYNTKSFNVVQ